MFPTTLEELKAGCNEYSGYNFVRVDKTNAFGSRTTRPAVVVVDDNISQTLQGICDKSYLSFCLNAMLSFNHILDGTRFGQDLSVVINNCMRSLGLSYSHFPVIVYDLAKLWVSINKCIDIEDEWLNSARAYIAQHDKYNSGESDIDPFTGAINVWSECVHGDMREHMVTYACARQGDLPTRVASFNHGTITIMDVKVDTRPNIASYLYKFSNNIFCADLNFGELASVYSTLVSDDDAITAAVKHQGNAFNNPLYASIITRLRNLSTPRLFGTTIADKLFKSPSGVEGFHVTACTHHTFYTKITMGHIITEQDDSGKSTVKACDIVQYLGQTVDDYAYIEPERALLVCAAIYLDGAVSLSNLPKAISYKGYLSALRDYIVTTLEIFAEVYKEVYTDIVRDGAAIVNSKTFAKAIELAKSGDFSDFVEEDRNLDSYINLCSDASVIASGLVTAVLPALGLGDRMSAVAFIHNPTDQLEWDSMVKLRDFYISIRPDLDRRVAKLI